MNGLEKLFPDLDRARKAMRRVSKGGRDSEQQELADALSRLLASTRSINVSKVKQAAAAAKDAELLANVEVLGSLLEKEVTDRIEDFLGGRLKGTDVGDLAQDFEQLEDVVEKIQASAPVAVAQMIRAQVETLRSGKTSSYRKASALSNFSRVSGIDLGYETVEDFVDAIESNTLDMERLIQTMESTAAQREQELEANEDLRVQLNELVAGVNSGLIETSDLQLAVTELIPVLEESSLNTSEFLDRAENDATVDLLQEMLEALNDAEQRDRINRTKLRADLDDLEPTHGRGRFDGLLPDQVARARDMTIDGLGDMLQGGALLALLGGSGALEMLGGIALDVAKGTFNWVKEQGLPMLWDSVKRLSEMLWNSPAVRAIRNFGDSIGDKLRTIAKVIVETISLAMRKAMAYLPGGQDPSQVRSAFLEGRELAIRKGGAVIPNENGGYGAEFLWINENGDIEKTLDSIEAQNLIDANLAADGRSLRSDNFRVQPLGQGASGVQWRGADSVTLGNRTIKLNNVRSTAEIVEAAKKAGWSRVSPREATPVVRGGGSSGGGIAPQSAVSPELKGLAQGTQVIVG